MKSPRRSPLLLLLLVLPLLASLPAAAEVEVLRVTFDPAVPTWEDPVVITVGGTSDCPVTGSSQVLRFVNDRPQVRVDLESGCATGGSSSTGRVLPDGHPFDLQIPVGYLEPDHFEVLVRSGSEVLAREDLRVRFPAAAVLDLPGGPVTDAEPLALELEVFASCAWGAEPRIGDRVVELFVDTHCPHLPPDPHLHRFPLEVGPLPPGLWEIRAWEVFGEPHTDRVLSETLRVYDADRCVPGEAALCLGTAGNFRVEVEWEDFQGNTGRGQAAPLAELEIEEGVADTGAFWFFNPANLELTVKVLDGCGVNGHHWVFLSSGSTVAYTVTVTDVASGEVWTSDNGKGQVPSLVADTAAFRGCPDFPL